MLEFETGQTKRSKGSIPLFASTTLESINGMSVGKKMLCHCVYTYVTHELSYIIRIDFFINDAKLSESAVSSAGKPYRLLSRGRRFES